MFALVRTFELEVKSKRDETLLVFSVTLAQCFGNTLLKHNETWWHQYHDRREFPLKTKLSGALRFSFWWSQDTLSWERLSISQRQTDLVAPRQLCCTPGGQELREKVRDWDIPRQPIFMSSGEKVRNLFRSLWIASSSNLEQRKEWSGRPAFSVMACFLHCFNFTYSQPQMRRQKHARGVPGVGVGGVMG